MNLSKKSNYISYTVVVILTLVCVYFVYKTISLKQDVDRLIDLQMSENRASENQQSLAIADSFLTTGNYEKALEQYQKLTKSSAVNTELRRTMTLKLLAMEKEVRKTKTAISENGDSALKVEISEEAPSIKTFDSLTFALEKAQMQLSSVKKQMKEKVFGEYLTFKSTKGNRLHYVGQVKNKKANGIGIAILDSGSRYEGEWHNNKRHGYGTFYWIDGEHYEGNYKDDLRSGEGTYYWTNGEKYVGHWDKDMRNGEGVFYGSDNEIITKGIWEDDKLIKEEK